MEIEIGNKIRYFSIDNAVEKRAIIVDITSGKGYMSHCDKLWIVDVNRKYVITNFIPKGAKTSKYINVIGAASPEEKILANKIYEEKETLANKVYNYYE